MTSNEQQLEIARRVQLGNYRPAPFVLTRGQGRRVEDVEGNRYLDLSGGIAVAAVGHAHPELARAVAEQAERLVHVSNLFYNDRAIELAAELTRRTPFDRVFFCNSGTEANEAMLKLARRFHFDRGEPQRTELVSAEGSFHGRTMGALSVTGQAKYHQGMQPLVGDVRHVPFGALDALRRVVGPRTAAVLLEPIQAEGGIVEAPDGYLPAVRALCDDVGALLLLDEVQTGYGRTGRFLAREHSGVVPDACALAKGIAGGFPLGAMLVREEIADGLPPGSHASTFGGNPVACAAALAVLRVFDRDGLVENAERAGRHLGRRLQALADDPSVPAAVEARGRGLLRGIRLSDETDPPALLAALRDRGVLLSLAGGSVLRVSPALNVTTEELDAGLEAIEAVLREPPR